MQPFSCASRRQLLAALTATALAPTLSAAPASAQRRDSSGQDDRFYEDPGLIRVNAQISPSRRFQPTALVMTGPGPGGGAPVSVIADLPRRAHATRVDRIDLSGVPLAGGLFRPRPETAEIEPERRIGSLYRAGGVLAAWLEPSAPADWAEARVSLVSREPRFRNTVAFALSPRYRPAPPPPTSGIAVERIGDVYAGTRGLVLAPPRAWLTGYDLQ